MSRLRRALLAARAAYRSPAPEAAVTPPVLRPHPYDSLLEHFFAELSELDVACAAAPGDRSLMARFAGLDDDLWAILLSQEQSVFPGIAAYLPSMPDPGVQEIWNGLSGAALSAQTLAFYTKVRDRFARHGARPLREARVLDHGIGWGRIARFFARDAAPGSLFGTDPSDSVLELCRRDGVPAMLHHIASLPDALPVADLDLAYAFSVFTHLSEAAAEASVTALHGALRPGGLLIMTVRAPDFLWLDPRMHGRLAALAPDWRARLTEPRVEFVAHPTQPFIPGHETEQTYGDAFVSLAHVRERWADCFELIDVAPLVGDVHQVVLTLHRR